jgi:hypothetical protein
MTKIKDKNGVIPAKAGIHFSFNQQARSTWMTSSAVENPAFAGMTETIARSAA